VVEGAAGHGDVGVECEGRGVCEEWQLLFLTWYEVWLKGLCHFRSVLCNVRMCSLGLPVLV
jgi:hypothetical protein